MLLGVLGRCSGPWWHFFELVVMLVSVVLVLSTVTCVSPVTVEVRAVASGSRGNGVHVRILRHTSSVRCSRLWGSLVKRVTWSWASTFTSTITLHFISYTISWLAHGDAHGDLHQSRGGKAGSSVGTPIHSQHLLHERPTVAAVTNSGPSQSPTWPARRCGKRHEDDAPAPAPTLPSPPAVPTSHLPPGSRASA